MSDTSGSIATQGTSASGLTDLTLAVRIEGVPDQEVFLQHGLSIGRNPSNTICVPDPEIERIHAQVMRQNDGTMLLECTSDHLCLKLADGSDVHSLQLKPGTTFKLGKAIIRCLKRETKPTVVVADNPWEVRCPRCHGAIADLPHDAHTCPHCQITLQFFQAHPQPSPTGAGDVARPTSDFEGWLPHEIGPYKIRAFVAQGGMGIILRGLHKESDLPAAVKLLKVDSDDDPTWRQRFMAEIETLKTLRHPNVVRLQDYGEDGKLLWLAMDWIDGLPLTKLASRCRADGKDLPVEQIKQILLQVVTGLKYLHEKQIIHRDLKPSNILMAQDDLVKMVDFGIARGASGQTSVVTQLTHTGMVAGTESYMSPEQSEGQAITPASDLYSLGVMWYELVTGRRPVGAFAAPHLLRADCPVGWSNTIAQCLSVDPRARPTLDRIYQALSGLGAAEPPPLPGLRGVLSAPPTAQAPWTPPPPTAQKTWGPPPAPGLGPATGVHAPGSGIHAAMGVPPVPPVPPPPTTSGGIPPVPPPPIAPAPPSGFDTARATATKAMQQTGAVIATGTRAAMKATGAFFEKHPPSRWIARLGPVGQWILTHRGPSIAIGVVVLLILIVVFIRACSSDDVPPAVNTNANQATPRNTNIDHNNVPRTNNQNVTPQPDAEQIFNQGVQTIRTARTPQDADRGYNLILKSAQAGHMPAMWALVEIHGTPNNGTYYDLNKCIYWLRQLAARGDANAQQRLAMMGYR